MFVHVKKQVRELNIVVVALKKTWLSLN